MVVVIVLLLVGAAVWFFFPAVMDVVKLQRQNARISALTKQTKRDMDNLARRQSRDGW